MLRGDWARFLALIVLFAVAGNAESRPRVGLALAGGSARGLAHVGVLVWLDEHRVPVDRIAGTSMGGLIAGLYAAGFEPAEIQQFISEVDWNRALRPDPAFRDLTFRRKEDRRDFPDQLEFGLKAGLTLPGGLSPCHGIGLLLSRFTSPYAGLSSFDDLPTPFRSVAVDLKDGSEYVFHDGNLFDALRATMAIPGVFSPWVVKDRILVDGGLRNNLPADVVKEMGADVIIAVPLKSHLIADEEMPTSLTGIAGRSLDIMLAGMEHRNIHLAQVVVSPELAGFGSADFHRWRELVELGYKAAAKEASRLEPLAVSPAEWTQYLEERQRRKRPRPASPAFLEIRGGAARNTLAVTREVSRWIAPPYPTARLEKALTWVTGWGRFESADYQCTERDGLIGYQVNLREKKHGPPFLNTLLLLDGSHSDGLRLGVGARLTFLDLGGPFSEWRSEANFGIFNRLATEFYWRLGGTRWFVAPRGFYEDSNFDVYREGNKELSVEFREPGAGLDLGYAGGRSDEVRFGYQLSRLTASQSLGVPTFPDASGKLGQFRLRWAHEGQDGAMVPRHGVRTVSELRWVTDSPLAKSEYGRFESRVSWAVPIKPRNTIVTGIEGGFATDDKLAYPVFSLGGPFRLSALSRDEMFGSRYYYASILFLRLLNEQERISSNFHMAAIYEVGSAFRLHESARPYHDVAIGIVGETPLGLLFFGPSCGENGQWKISFRVGKFF